MLTIHRTYSSAFGGGGQGGRRQGVQVRGFWGLAVGSQDFRSGLRGSLQQPCGDVKETETGERTQPVGQTTSCRAYLSAGRQVCHDCEETGENRGPQTGSWASSYGVLQNRTLSCPDLAADLAEALLADYRVVAGFLSRSRVPCRTCRQPDRSGAEPVGLATG